MRQSWWLSQGRQVAGYKERPNPRVAGQSDLLLHGSTSTYTPAIVESETLELRCLDSFFRITGHLSIAIISMISSAQTSSASWADLLCPCLAILQKRRVFFSCRTCQVSLDPSLRALGCSPQKCNDATLKSLTQWLSWVISIIRASHKIILGASPAIVINARCHIFSGTSGIRHKWDPMLQLRRGQMAHSHDHSSYGKSIPMYVISLSVTSHLCTASTCKIIHDQFTSPLHFGGTGGNSWESLTIETRLPSKNKGFIYIWIGFIRLPCLLPLISLMH